MRALHKRIGVKISIQFGTRRFYQKEKDNGKKMGSIKDNYITKDIFQIVQFSISGSMNCQLVINTSI